MLNRAIQGLAESIFMLLCVGPSSIYNTWNFLIFLLNKYYFVSIFVARFDLLKHCLFPFQLSIYKPVKNIFVILVMVSRGGSSKYSEIF